MALSFLESRTTPRGNTFLPCVEPPPILKRCHSFSGFMSVGQQEFSEEVLEMNEWPNLQVSHDEVTSDHAMADCKDFEVEDSRFQSSASELGNDNEDMQLVVWPDTDDEESDIEQYQKSRLGTFATWKSAVSVCSTLSLAEDHAQLNLLASTHEASSMHAMAECSRDANRTGGSEDFEVDTRFPSSASEIDNDDKELEAFNWPDTEEEESDIEQYQRSRRGSFPTWKSAVSVCSTLSLAELIPEPADPALIHHEKDQAKKACKNSTCEGMVLSIPAKSYACVCVGVVEGVGGPNSLPLFAAPQPPFSENSHCMKKPNAPETTLPPCLSAALKDSIDDCQQDVNAPSRGPEVGTTLMIRNLPSCVLQAELLQEVDASGFRGTYDFAYMPQFFDRQESKGFAFINFMSVVVAGMFVAAWHGQHRFNKSPEEPLINVSAADLQGKEANMQKWGGQRMRRIKNPKLRPFVLASK